MQVRPSDSAFLIGEDVCGAKIKALVLCLCVELERRRVEVEVITNDALHQEVVKLTRPLVLVHGSLDQLLLFNVFGLILHF